MNMWDERFSEPGYAYGTEPNDFIRSIADRIPPGPVLCLAEGQGRNAVFLAARGHDVTAVDLSSIGMARAAELARARGVTLRTVTADLMNYKIEAETWSGIIATFAHFEPALRSQIFRAAAAGLRPGGVLAIECYAPRQLELNTGGPKSREMLVTPDEIAADLKSLDLIIAREVVREVIEGKYHTGRAAVTQVLAARRKNEE